MSDPYFAVALALAAVSGVGALLVLVGVPQLEKRLRRREAAQLQPAE